MHKFVTEAFWASTIRFDVIIGCAARLIVFNAFSRRSIDLGLTWRLKTVIM